VTRDAVVDALARGGFVAAEEEADELLACGGDVSALLERRLTGEPLAWITGRVEFCGLSLAVHPGVYVPRWHTELIAERAAARLESVAIDLCCGCGAVARVLSERRPGARVIGTERDGGSVACARANGVEVYEGDLFEPLPALVADVIVAVVPYVPTAELPLLQRDTFAFETTLAYDGGSDGLDLLRRVVAEAPRWLRPGGWLVLELGGDQAARLDFSAYATADVIRDEEGDVRGVEAMIAAS
jgi:release factor glutamine methyltransferase